MSARTKHLGLGLRVAFFGLLALVVLSYVGFKVPVPTVVYDYSTFLLVGLFLAMQAFGALNASGAFEVVDVQSGAVLFSKLRTGEMPVGAHHLLDLLAATPHSAPAATAKAAVRHSGVEE
jgi:hypothetical protein